MSNSFPGPEDASPSIADCSFVGNTAEMGGGMYNLLGSSPTVRNCWFADNAADHGGGIFSTIARPTVIGCGFVRNTARVGGGMKIGGYGGAGAAIVLNCIFAGNTATDQGGALANQTSCPIFCIPSHADVINCILWGNGPDPIFVDPSASPPSSATLLYCNIENGWSGAE